jgi:16S rRNA (uracil1498-N3)-methyltransferase
LNILILEEAEVGAPIPRSDRRWGHVKKVLKKKPGDRIEAGIACEGDAEGALGEAVLRTFNDNELVLDFEPRRAAPPLAPLRVVLGFPRPIQASRILKDLTSLGVAEIFLTGTELGEKSYAQSSIFKERDFRGPLIEGAEQAGNPRLPRVSTHWTLRRCLEAIAAESGPGSGSVLAGIPGSCIFLHPYGESERMGKLSDLRAPVTIAVGSERGWTEAEIGVLRDAGFAARGLGGRILKTETAVLAASVLALAGLGLL